MEKKRTIQRTSNKKRGRPKLRFNIGVVIIIFALSFMGCFAMYMVAANVDGNFIEDTGSEVVENVQGATEATTQAPTQQPVQSITYPVPQSAAVDASYFVDCCMIADSTLSGIASQQGFMEVITAQELGAANCDTLPVSEGATAAAMVKAKNPKAVYIMLGADLGTASVENMIAGYGRLIEMIKTDCPGAKIYVMQMLPVKTNTETLTNNLINSYNSKLMDVAKAAGVYCIDTNTALKGTNGMLSAEFANYNGTLNNTAYNKVINYILTHTV